MKNAKLSAILAVFCLCLVILTFSIGCGKKVPKIDSVSPESAQAGEKIKLTGTDFGLERGEGVVYFSIDESADVASWSDTRITCKVPEALKPGSYDIRVRNNAGGESNEVSFTVKAAGGGTVIEDEPENNLNEEEVEKEEAEDEGVERAEEVKDCQSVMLGYAQQNSEPGIEFSIDKFWMNKEGTEAEATLKGVWAEGTENGEELENSGITAKKKGGRWVVTSFGTGVNPQHL